MRSPSLFACVVATLTVLASAACVDEPEPLNVDAEPPSAAQVDESIEYVVTALPAPDGEAAAGRGVNSRGWVAGLSHLPGGDQMQATIWRDGEATRLGTLGGPNSSLVWPGLNQGGTVVGIAETSELDPEGENFSCFFFFPGQVHTGHKCVGFVWSGGEMRALPTLGGHNGFASAVNERGQVVGWAENTVRDPTCQEGSQVFQFRAVLWGPDEGEIRELPPFPGDSTSAAVAINNRGQVVGISGDCDQAVGRASARHAVMWNRGQVVDLGSLGGDTWNTPTYINERGDVVGFAGTPVDQGGPGPLQAFLWTRKDGMRALGTLESAGCVGTHQAMAINDRRQVVGIATGCADGVSHAFLWDGDTMKDLNDLVADETDVRLIDARDIDDRGQITGAALDPETGDVVPFVAKPRGGALRPR